MSCVAFAEPGIDIPLRVQWLPANLGYKIPCVAVRLGMRGELPIDLARECSMRRFAYQTVDVFTDQRFGGNPLAVFTDARGLTDAEMQSLAAEINYSETTFVLPPVDLGNTARVRIFNRQSEMPFAGHPNVGTGCILAAMGRDRGGELRFEEASGVVSVQVIRDDRGRVTGAHIDAPQPLAVGNTLPVDLTAACAGLSPDDVIVDTHGPRMVSVGLPFCLVEVTPVALESAAPDAVAFQRLASHLQEAAQRLAIHCYARGDHPNTLDARMFAPVGGTLEDPATGSANAALAAYLLSLDGKAQARFEITQGTVMGRPSRLLASAVRGPDGISAKVGGDCVQVLRGEALLD